MKTRVPYVRYCRIQRRQYGARSSSFPDFAGQNGKKAVPDQPPVSIGSTMGGEMNFGQVGSPSESPGRKFPGTPK
jgi:hypothetical protein